MGVQWRKIVCPTGLYAFFYELEHTMHREYGESQKSVDFLNKAMKSTKYHANAKIFKHKIMDKDLHKEPPDNLHLNKIATTLD